MDASLVLASGSETRAKLLRDAGVPFEVRPASIDEGAVKAAMRAEGASGRDMADVLAEMKARRVSGRMADRLVLGADQVLVCDGRSFDKPDDLEAAVEQLRALRGRTHDLYSAAVVYLQGEPVWRHVGRATLTMRAFSETFLARYVADHGAALLGTVGGYRIETGGVQLFSRIDGDYFSVLGLPLLELLGYLRVRGVCLE